MEKPAPLAMGSKMVLQEFPSCLPNCFFIPCGSLFSKDDSQTICLRPSFFLGALRFWLLFLIQINLPQMPNLNETTNESHQKIWGIFEEYNFLNWWTRPPSPSVYLGIKMSLLAKKNHVFKANNNGHQNHIKFRHSGSPPYLENIPKRYQYFLVASL